VTRAYLDHASTSPLRDGVLEAMLPFLVEHVADPGRVHSEGRATRVALETARERVATFFDARPREVVFTSGGTEAVNAAVWGAVARATAAEGRNGRRPHVVASAVEHSSVLDACRRHDVDLTLVPVDRQGRFTADDVEGAVRDDTTLVTVQLANHEVGTLQPAAEVAARVRARGPRHVLVHVDACAAAGQVPVSFRALDADLCSVTAHTFGGPKGAGALLVRRGLRVPPFVVGGAQERARRGGIENVPAMVGFAAACDLVVLEREPQHARDLTEAAWRRAVEVDGVTRYGDPDRRIPNVLCFGVAGVEAEPILLALDQRGVALHSGSSCSSETLEPSPVLEAMGVDADHSLRLSVGWSSTEDDVERFAAAFPDVVTRLRSLR
jgi:cysteine desulfurase